MPPALAITDPDLDAKLETLGAALKLMRSKGQGTDPTQSATFAEDFRSALNATRYKAGEEPPTGGAVKAGEGVSGGISQDDRVSLDVGQWAYPAIQALPIRTADEVRNSMAKFLTTQFPDDRVKAAAAKRLRNAAKTYQVQIDEAQLKMAEPLAFADAPGGAGGVPTNGAFEHTHEHEHEDGNKHVHNHWHYAGTNQHSQGSSVPHDHEHEEPSTPPETVNKYEADRAPDPKKMPKPGAVVTAAAESKASPNAGAPSILNVVPGRQLPAQIDVAPERQPSEDPAAFYKRLRNAVLARPTDAPDVALAAETADRRLDREARRLMGERHLDYREALRVAAGDASTIPNSSAQQIRDGRQLASVLQTSQATAPVWNAQLQTWETVPSEADAIKAKLLGKEVPPAKLSASERIEHYAELKQEALGKPAPVRREAARESVRRMGEQLKASEPAPVVANDHADLVQASEDYRAARWTGFGERVSVKEALLKVSKGRR